MTSRESEKVSLITGLGVIRAQHITRILTNGGDKQSTT